METPFNWSEYIQAVQGRMPRRLFLHLLSRFEAEAERPTARFAIDLGCGDGVETRFLLARGWQVLAVDQQPEALAHLQASVPLAQHGQLSVQLAAFHEAQLPPADLIYAGLSLPYCAPRHFVIAWRKLISALRPGGRFAGHLFGERDDYARYPGVTGQSRGQVQTLLQELTIELCDETEGDVVAADGAARHWHKFEVIARKAG
jgi:tellurite methyltransferase